MSLEPGTNLGQYRIIERLGRGGMATVYKAYQPSLDRHVAIKVLPAFYAEDPAYMQRFRQEARAIAKLRHPNILAVHDFGEEAGTTYIVSEYVPGGTLGQYLGQPLSLDFAISLLRPIASGLDYAHSQNIIHRDVKPSNILMALDGTPIISDFGVAKMVGSGSFTTETGVSVGTPEYMAPEQAVGKTSAASDVYALGVVLYQMMTGRVPFVAETPMGVVLAHLHEPLPMPRSVRPEIPEDMQDVILKALSKRPEDRFKSAGEMVQALERCLPAGAVTATALPPPVARAVEPPQVATSTTSAEVRATGPGQAPVPAAPAVQILSEPARPAVHPPPQPEPPAAPPVTKKLPASRLALLAAPVALLVLAGGAMMLQGAQGSPAAPAPTSVPQAVAKPKPAATPVPAPTQVAPGAAASLPTRPAGAGVTATSAAASLPTRPAQAASPAVISVEMASKVAVRNTLPAQKEGLTSVAIAGDGKTLASAAGEVKLWDLGTSKETRTVLPQKAIDLAFSPDGKGLAIAGADDRVYLLAMEGAPEPRKLGAHKEKLASVAFVPGQRLVVSGGADGLKVWNLAQLGSEPKQFPGIMGVTSIAVSRDGSLVAAGGVSGEVRAWDWAEGKEVLSARPFAARLAGAARVTGLAFSLDGKVLAATSTVPQPNLKLYDMSKGVQLPTAGGTPGGANALAMSYGRLLVSAGADGVVRLYDWQALKEVGTLSGHTKPVTSLAFSGDYKLLASGSEDGTVRIWHIPQ